MNIRSGRSLCTVALCAIAAFGISPAGQAGDGPECRGKTAHLDAEGSANGTINAADHAAGARKRFDAMDADGDGRITAAEITASQGAERIAWTRKPLSSTDKIRAFDRNKDGVLSVQEYADGSQAIFDKLDTDNDGYLRGAEIEVDMDRMSARESD